MRREDRKPKENQKPKPVVLSFEKKKELLRQEIRDKFRSAFKHELDSLLYPDPRNR